jgi:hypothetical protein
MSILDIDVGDKTDHRAVQEREICINVAHREPDDLATGRAYQHLTLTVRNQVQETLPHHFASDRVYGEALIYPGVTRHQTKPQFYEPGDVFSLAHTHLATLGKL